MIRIFALILSFVFLGSIPFCNAEANVETMGLVSSGDPIFKLALAKVIFFLSLLAIGAALIKKHKKNPHVEHGSVCGFRQLQEISLANQVKLTLLEVEEKRIVLASSPTGGLTLLELSSIEQLNKREDLTLELVQKNISKAI